MEQRPVLALCPVCAQIDRRTEHADLAVRATDCRCLCSTVGDIGPAMPPAGWSASARGAGDIGPVGPPPGWKPDADQGADVGLGDIGPAGVQTLQAVVARKRQVAACVAQ